MELGDCAIEIQKDDDNPETVRESASSRDPDFATSLVTHTERKLSEFEGYGLNLENVTRYDPDYDGSEHVILRVQNGYRRLRDKHGSVIQKAIYTILVLGYGLYFVCAIWYSVDGAMALIVITSLVISVIVYEWVKKRFGIVINDNIMTPVGESWDRNWSKLKW